MYGNVVRVKILFNKKDNALLQMSDIQQSETAMNYLKVRGLKHKLGTNHFSIFSLIDF